MSVELFSFCCLQFLFHAWNLERRLAGGKQDELGQGLVEYALILVLVAVIVIGILSLLGPQIGNVFSRLLAPSYCGQCICGTSICN